MKFQVGDILKQTENYYVGMSDATRSNVEPRRFKIHKVENVSVFLQVVDCLQDDFLKLGEIFPIMSYDFEFYELAIPRIPKTHNHPLTKIFK